MALYDDKLIVLTGGAGFIGSCVLKELNTRGYKNIVVVDNLGTSEKWKNLVGKSFIDVLHKDVLFSWLEGRESEIGAFIHLGACSNTVEKNANYLLENNYRYSVRLVEYAQRHGQRFLYASSASTYGDGSRGFSDDHDQLEEFSPLNMYGYSKHLFDLWLKRQGLLTQVVGLKYFNVFGPNEYHKGRMASAIVHLLPQVLQKGYIELFASNEPEVYKDGEQKRDFIYVKDVARQTVLFLLSQQNGIFNIGTGRATSWNELARAIFAATGVKEEIRYTPLPQDLLGKYQNFTQSELQKTEQALGKEASSTPCSAAVKEYVRDYLMKDVRL